MHAFRTLRERSLEELLWSVVSCRDEGLVVVREWDGARHGVWLHGGFVVGIHVAGRFDPLLDSLRQSGRLSSAGYRACVQSLTEPGPRAGAVAVSVGGLSRLDVRDALKAQSRARMAALLQIATERGHDARFEPQAVPPSEVSIRMPLGALFSAAARGDHDSQPGRGTRPVVQPPAADRGAQRRHLRDLARRLHPDLHANLPEAERRRLESELAEATARYHGLAS